MRLRFRDLLFDVGTRSLTRGERPVPLSPKAFRLLEVLVMRRPDAVSHEELRRTLWSDAADGGTTLARLVSEIRTALDDHDDGQPIVRTVHRFGYAFAEASRWKTSGRRSRSDAMRSGGAVSSFRSPTARISSAAPSTA